MPRILLLPNGGGEPNLIQLTMWPSILEKIGATVILAEAPSKRRGLSKKKKKNVTAAAHQTFDIVVSSYSSLEKSQSKLTEFGLNYSNAVFVSGKEWWKTKNMKDPIAMTLKPSTTTTTITKSSSTTASSSSSTSSSSTSGLKRSRDEETTKAHISQKKSKPTSSAGLQMLAPPIDNRCSQSNSTNNNFVILVYVKVDEECSTFIDACTSTSPEINGTLQQVGTRHFTVVKGISSAMRIYLRPKDCWRVTPVPPPHAVPEPAFRNFFLQQWKSTTGSVGAPVCMQHPLPLVNVSWVDCSIGSAASLL